MREDHDLLLKTRNAAAHGVLSDPERALQAVEISEEILNKIAESLSDAANGAR